MYTISTSSQFKRDVKRCKKQQQNMALFKDINERLIQGKTLLPKHSDHPLTGNWRGHRDCHMAPDWLLIYRVFTNKKHIEYVRMGSHAELFG